jgi:hypothetical protein
LTSVIVATIFQPRLGVAMVKLLPDLAPLTPREAI